MQQNLPCQNINANRVTQKTNNKNTWHQYPLHHMTHFRNIVIGKRHYGWITCTLREWLINTMKATRHDTTNTHARTATTQGCIGSGGDCNGNGTVSKISYKLVVLLTPLFAKKKKSVILSPLSVSLSLASFKSKYACVCIGIVLSCIWCCRAILDVMVSVWFFLPYFVVVVVFLLVGFPFYEKIGKLLTFWDFCFALFLFFSFIIIIVVVIAKLGVVFIHKALLLFMPLSNMQHFDTGFNFLNCLCVIVVAFFAPRIYPVLPLNFHLKMFVFQFDFIERFVKLLPHEFWLQP